MAAVVVALAWAAWALLSARRVENLATRADKAHPEVAKEIEEMTKTR